MSISWDHRPLEAVAGDQSLDAVIAVGEDAHRQQPPEAGGPMDGNGAHRVIDLEDPFDEHHRTHHDGSRDRADYHCGPRLDESYRGVMPTRPANAPLQAIRTSVRPVRMSWR